MKGLWDSLDGDAKASVANDMHESLIRSAPRYYAALERQDTDAAWEVWNGAISEVWSGACDRSGVEKGCQVRGRVVRVVGQAEGVAPHAGEDAEAQADHEAGFRQRLRALRR
eukprot:9409998-Alexandrium_andersonii.AAC.1